MTSPDDAPDGKPGVTVRCQDNASVGVTFRDRTRIVRIMPSSCEPQA